MSDVTIRGGGTDFAAWIAVGISVCALLLTWYWNRRNERRSSRDSYWFREVLAPSCLDPVRNFRKQWSQRILGIVGQQLTVVQAQLLIADAQRDLAALRREMWLARLFKGNFFQDTAVVIDQIEDAVANRFSRAATATGPFTDDAARVLIDEITAGCLTVLQGAASLHDGKLKIQEA